MVVRRRLKITGRAAGFVTMTVVRWKPIFADERFAMAMIVQLEETLRYYTTGLIGYVLMPTHLHLLMTLPKIEHLSQFVQGLKILSAKRIYGNDDS
jgi:REP element-mobilizing transposase RayT